MKLADILKDIESIEFKVSSEKSVSIVPSLEERIEAVYEDDAPECRYFTDFTIEAYATDGMNVIAGLGFLKGTSIEAACTFTDVGSFLELGDMVSTDIYHLAVAVTGADGQIKESVCPPDRNMMYIENVYVEEPYRGRGLGRYLLDNANALFTRALNYSHYVCLLKPYPQVKCGDLCLRDAKSPSEDEVARLVRFYERAGYRFVEGSGYMYKAYPGPLDELLQMLEG